MTEHEAGRRAAACACCGSVPGEDNSEVEQQESHREQARRQWVVRREEFKDASEAYEARRAVAATDEERQALMGDFAAYRRAHREEDIRKGKRSPELSVSMHQIMWARWAEVAVEHEIEAREAFAQIVDRAHSDPLLREFRASLVAVTAAAHTVEALLGDIKYLIPAQARRNSRALVLWHAFRQAFGIPDDVGEKLKADLGWLFDLRGQAAHPYTESEPPQLHPAGINTGVENSRFNAVTSGRAVDIAMTFLEYAAAPSTPHGRWIERWATDRKPYHDGVIAALREARAAQPLRLP